LAKKGGARIRIHRSPFFAPIFAKDLTMKSHISHTFTHTLARLTGGEQKGVKATAFDLWMNPASSGLHFHKLDKARGKNFWSVRVSGDKHYVSFARPALWAWILRIAARM
jgi:hypothetical protein